jgi:AcrR family transcriptional regulator
MRLTNDAGPADPMAGEGRTAVLTSAITVFAARGVEAARMSDIARHAGISLPSLEREFGSKDELFQTALQEVARRQVARACSELPPGPAIEQLRNLCGRGWELLHTPTFAAVYRLRVTEVPRYPALARFYAEEVYGAVHGMLVRIIERGIVEGQLQPVNPQVAAKVILAALVEQAFWCNHAEAFGPALGGGCNRVVADTLSILFGGLQPSRPDPTS